MVQTKENATQTSNTKTTLIINHLHCIRSATTGKKPAKPEMINKHNMTTKFPPIEVRTPST